MSEDKRTYARGSRLAVTGEPSGPGPASGAANGRAANPRAAPAAMADGTADGPALRRLPDGQPPNAAARRLGTELRRLRLELGISQRRLTQLVGLSAHSNMGDYERGRRIPPGDSVVACERTLAVDPGYLQRLRRLALQERARERL